MFYAATALLLRKGLLFKRHSAVIAAFGREFAKGNAAWREHHRHLIRAELLRLEGDYDLYAEVAAEDVVSVLAWAEAFVKDVGDWLER